MIPTKERHQEPTPEWGWHQDTASQKAGSCRPGGVIYVPYCSIHPFAAQQTLLRCWAQFLCGRCRAREEGGRGASGGQLPGTQPGLSPSSGHPSLSAEKQQLHPGDQDQVSAMFEVISCSSCCTLHPHHPRASFDGEVPISHPASGQAPRLPCDDALWGLEEESEPWFPHMGQSALLSSLP